MSQSFQLSAGQQNLTGQQNDNFIYQQPSKQPYQYTIYLNNCQGYVGSQIIQTFRNDHLIQQNPNIIIGSLTTNQTSNSQNKISQISGVTHIIDINQKTLYNSIVKSSDIIIFTLDKNNLQEFQYLLKLLKNMQLQKQKKVICITSFISWAGRRNSHSIVQVKEDQIYLRQSLDYHIKQLQNLCLSLHSLNHKLKGSVIYSGLIYGLGQDQLFSYFKKALQQQAPLQIYGKGTNKIPTIHLADLCQIVQNIAFSECNLQKNQRNWHFACDQSNLTQKQIIQVISTNLGNGRFIQKPIQQCFLKENFDIFTIDLQIKCSKAGLKSWTSKQGIKANIGLIVSQFNQYRGLKPNKILIIGLPAAGKSTVAQILAKNYGLPILTIKGIIQEIKKEDSQFANQIKKILEQLKAVKVQEQRKAHEQMKKKNKGKGVQDFDPQKVVPRLPDQYLVKVIKRRLNCSDCLNKGYILDGVFKTYSQAQKAFQNQNGLINNQIFPNSVFKIEGTQEDIKDRVKKLPNQKTQNTHWTEQHTIRRLQTYIKDNQGKQVKTFFQGKVDIKQVQFNYSDPNIFIQFIERNGPLGFKKKIIEQVPLIVEKQEKKNQQQQQNQQQQNQQEEQIEQEEFNLQKLTEKQQKILNQKSRPIRQYLIDNVIPQMTEGLLQICKEIPQDPIDFLIKFLQKKNTKHRK